MASSATKEIVFLREMFIKNQDALTQYVESQKSICEKTLEAAKKFNAFDFIELSKLLKSKGVETGDIDEMLVSFSEAAKALEETTVQQKNTFENLVTALTEIKQQVEAKMNETTSSKSKKNSTDDNDD